MKFSKRRQRNLPWIPLIASDARGFREKKEKKRTRNQKTWVSNSQLAAVPSRYHTFPGKKTGPKNRFLVGYRNTTQHTSLTICKVSANFDNGGRSELKSGEEGGSHECCRPRRAGRAPTWERGWRDRADEMSKYVRIGEPVLSLRACGFTNKEREETRT